MSNATQPVRPEIISRAEADIEELCVASAVLVGIKMMADHLTDEFESGEADRKTYNIAHALPRLIEVVSLRVEQAIGSLYDAQHELMRFAGHESNQAVSTQSVNFHTT